VRDDYEIGAGLREALEARGCALSDSEARALSVALIELIASGLLVADSSAETVPARNTGQSLYIQGGGRG
jgi:hypothetical protein